MAGAARTARMAGSSIAAPGAAGWVTDFLNAAYYARGEDERDVDDLRLALAVLTTRWARAGGRRLGVRDLPAFHRAYGLARLGAGGRLDRDALLTGAQSLLGDWFADAYADPRRRAHGVVFPTRAGRSAFDPATRRRFAALGDLTPPRAPADERHWTTYDPVALSDPDAALALLADPARWPDIGGGSGRFTALGRGGLRGQTFEIEVVALLARRAPIFARAYVTATAVHRRGRALERAVRDVLAHVPEALPAGGEALGLIELTTHAGHFLGAAVSRLLLFADDGRAFVRDIGCWDPLPRHLSAAYALAGREAQAAFWGPEPADLSMLAQLARVSSGR